MRRREFLAGCAAASCLSRRTARAADPRSAAPAGQRLVGFFDVRPAPNLQRAFESGLREHGLEPGRDVRIDYREAGGRIERFATIAAEFVAMPVDLIVAPNTTAALNVLSLSNASGTIGARLLPSTKTKANAAHTAAMNAPTISG